MAVGVEADPDQPGAEERLVGLDRSAVVDRHRVERRVGVLVVDAVEELLRFGREQRDLLLLHQDREQRVALVGLDQERARTGIADRTGTDGVDGIELDVIGHASASFASGAAPSEAAGSGRSSSSPPVSLHFTSRAPYGWKSNTVTDAGET